MLVGICGGVQWVAMASAEAWSCLFTFGGGRTCCPQRSVAGIIGMVTGILDEFGGLFMLELNLAVSEVIEPAFFAGSLGMLAMDDGVACAVADAAAAVVLFFFTVL